MVYIATLPVITLFYQFYHCWTSSCRSLALSSLWASVCLCTFTTLCTSCAYGKFRVVLCMFCIFPSKEQTDSDGERPASSQKQRRVCSVHQVSKRNSREDTQRQVWYVSMTCAGITVCVQVANKLPDPFPIPLFRKSTMDALEQKKYTTDDRKYMIRVLSTMMLTYVQRATMNDCACVCKALTWLCGVL